MNTNSVVEIREVQLAEDIDSIRHLWIDRYTYAWI